MATNFIEWLAAVASVCLENVANNERLKHIGLTDALTGVHNRRYFDQRLREEVDRALRKGQPLSCLLVDVDHFKHVNDKHGHLIGDAVLREVAEQIKDQLRLSDAMARYGGEEFAVLLVQTDG
jgi:two-component system, cell cycle response regulator